MAPQEISRQITSIADSLWLQRVARFAIILCATVGPFLAKGFLDQLNANTIMNQNLALKMELLQFKLGVSDEKIADIKVELINRTLDRYTRKDHEGYAKLNDERFLGLKGRVDENGNRIGKLEGYHHRANP